MSPRPDPGQLARRLLEWYDRHGRRLPWRGDPADPYAVWLSEIMLQQTTVATVIGYYRRFLERWPTLAALAAAERDEVLAAWAGLGYYARARNLHKCAQELAARGKSCGFPQDEAELLRLPGIGPYTAAAIAAIAFDRPATVVDGNVERVMARLHAVSDPLPGAKPRLRELARRLTPERRPGDYAQALMDLGATICRPRAAACPACPWQADCLARRQGVAGELPTRSRRAARPLRHGVAFWISDTAGRVLLRRRPDDGLLGGMMGFPTTSWRQAAWSPAQARRQGPLKSRWRRPGQVAHGFTHFRLELMVLAGECPNADLEGLWCKPAEFEQHALPTLMKKVANLAQKN